MTTYRLACIPGDGIGPEVVASGLEVIRRAGTVINRFTVETTDLPWSCAYYLEHGVMMPPDGLAILQDHDAIYLGAVGFPTVPDYVSLRGLLLPIRTGFDQYVNLRPVRVLDGIASPLRNGTAQTVDILCVRENTEGEYVGLGGRFKRNTPDEVAVQVSVFTRKGVERIGRYAFEQAQRRRQQLASATKSNAMQYTAVLWDEVMDELAREFPDVTLTRYHVDALAARFVTNPESLDVVVGSNLFADILTDLGGALQGSLGLAASANLNPERKHPSMFEPVHGSAPSIAGRGIANPLAAVWSAALLLEHLEEREASRLVMRALEQVAARGPHTPDLGGSATTGEVTSALAEAIG
ncbi:MAG TPA: tartrate dehydrogenase [Candidatus Dormibacteraeota bacterium]|nr:tartrate dehydrogenase [Candidatus Dormibacteraeota bacterium]